jgi:cytoskeletal protein CcmA (bactofilin family)
MFSKNRPPEGRPAEGERAGPETRTAPSQAPTATPAAPKAKPPASMLSSDLTITGNIRTSGDIQIEGTIEGDVHAHLLTVGESAVVRGEIVADDIVVNGHVIGRVRGLKVRLTSSAKVEGDIIHKTIAIESGAHFEGSVQRQDDPLKSGTPQKAIAAPKPADQAEKAD